MKKGDRVLINTDTIYDTEGIPFSIKSGVVIGHVHEVEDDWCQVLIAGKNFGPEMFGVDIKFLLPA
jgi:hypothetical protein